MKIFLEQTDEKVALFNKNLAQTLTGLLLELLQEAPEERNVFTEEAFQDRVNLQAETLSD